MAKPSKVEATFRITRGDEDVELLVRGTVHRSREDWGWETVAEIDDVRLDVKGEPKWTGDLTERETENALDALCEQWREDEESDRGEAADRWHDERNDRAQAL